MAKTGAVLTVVVCCAGLLPAVAAGPAWAAKDYTFVVNSTADAHDANPGQPVCATETGTCTLRAALEAASALPAGAVVSVDTPAGTYDLTLGSLDAGANTIIIDGAGAASTVVDAQGASRVLQVASVASATIEGLTLTGGNGGGSGYGGAVLNDGRLVVTDSDFTGDTAASGGALSNAGGTMTIAGSDFTGDNDGGGYGGGAIQNGGISDLPGSVAVMSSSFSGDSAGDDGGAILNGQNGHPSGPGIPASPRLSWRAVRAQRASESLPTLKLTVTGSTFSSDQSSNAGGGISNEGGVATLSGDVFSYDAAPASVGGAIYSYGTLTLSRSALRHSSSCYGGAMELIGGGTSSSATIGQSTLTDNKAGCFGGAIDVSATSVTVTQSTLAGNSSGSGGGGAAVEIEGSSSGSFTNSTFYGNTNSSAIQTFECGPVDLTFDTFSGNTDALASSCPDSTVLGTILANSTGANCVGAAPVSEGYNLDSGDSCGLTKPTDITAANPHLGPLATNGGPTQTMALLAGSPAIDHAGTRSTGCPPVDQRGVLRPQGPKCDIGAFEKRVK